MPRSPSWVLGEEARGLWKAPQFHWRSTHCHPVTHKRGQKVTGVPAIAPIGHSLANEQGGSSPRPSLLSHQSPLAPTGSTMLTKTSRYGEEGRDHDSSTRAKLKNPRGLRTPLKLLICAGKAGTRNPKLPGHQQSTSTCKKGPNSARSIEASTLWPIPTLLGSVPATLLSPLSLQTFTCHLSSHTSLYSAEALHLDQCVPIPTLPTSIKPSFPPNIVLCHKPSHSLEILILRWTWRG